MRLHESLVVRVILVLACALAVVAALVEAIGSFATIAERIEHPSRVSANRVAQEQGVDPLVLIRLSALIPVTASYGVELAPRLAGTVYGQAFLAMLRARLLPRIEVPAVKARWNIVWGRPVGSADRVWRAGRVRVGDPRVLVTQDG